MRVGIDGRVLLGRKTGDRTYTFNLLRALQKLDTPHELVLYLTREPDTLLRHDLQGYDIRVSPPTAPYLWTLFRLPHLAREDALDVLHVQYMTPLRCPCPVVSTIHDISFRLHPEWFRFRDRVVMNTFVPRSIARTSALITPSQSAADNIAREYGYPRERIFVTPEAADSRFFENVGAIEARRCRDKFHIEGRYMLYVGNIQPRKNVARLIRAFETAREQHQLCDQLLLAGQFGWKCNDARRALKRAGQKGYVRHLGYVSDDDLPALYSEAVAFLFPTLHEGFGLPVLEAMASGTPVITSNTSSLPEVAGDAALLVDPADEEAITHAIGRMATDATLRRRLSEAGRNRAGEFSWSNTATATLEAFEAAVDGANRT